MSDMYFKSLPDTSTPLIPDNLDKLNDIKVSPTEPTTNEKVWIQKGKNLIKNFLMHYQLTGTGLTPDDYCATTDYIEILLNTDYIFSNSLNTPAGGIYVFDKNKVFLERISIDNNLAVININNLNAKYITILTWATNIDDLQWMQLEQGPTATEHEEYIEKAIYAKNDNGLYEKFYSEDALNSMSANDWVFDLRQIGTFDISLGNVEMDYHYSDLPASLMDNAVVIPQVNWFKAFSRATLYDGNKVKVMIDNYGPNGVSTLTWVSVLLIYRKSILG